jgi:DNA-binding GntR family transcriptional regulator
LESEDLVIYQPYKGFVVNPITIADIDQLYTIRISLEGLAGRLATPIISQDPKKLKVLIEWRNLYRNIAKSIRD